MFGARGAELASHEFNCGHGPFAEEMACSICDEFAQGLLFHAADFFNAAEGQMGGELSGVGWLADLSCGGSDILLERRELI
jgi:hypothetical protein